MILILTSLFMKNINIFELSLFYNRPKIGLEFGFYAKSNIYIYIYINKSLYFSCFSKKKKKSLYFS